MTDAPPRDPAEHARDFSRRYARELDYHAAQAMLDLGIPPEKIGDSDPLHGIRHAAFHPDYGEGGGVSPDGRIILDSGVVNPALMDPLGPRVAEAWRKARLRRRLEAGIAHEYEEGKDGGHAYAVEHAPETELSIDEQARELLGAIRDAERGRRSVPPAGPTPPA